MKSAINRFLNIHCKFIMKKFYAWKYKIDIYECLLIYKAFHDINLPALTRDYVLTVLATANGWTTHRALRAWALCIYCGFVEYVEKIAPGVERETVER